MGGCCSGNFSKEQWFTLVVIGSVHFASAICISLQAPFYPEEAESKNATATEYGFVFGSYELVSFIFSPILGNYIDHFGAKFLLNIGVITAGVCSILFGLLDLIKGHVSFVVLSFLVRMVEAVGSSAAVTSAFAITAVTFPDNIATTFATLEIFYGLGYIVGPTLGGLLFSAGGFILPFVFMGVLLILDGVVIFCFLPSYKRDRTKLKGRLLDIIKIPAVLLDSFSITGFAMGIGFYSATLEPHIRQFMLSPIALGFLFIIHGGTYAIAAPFVGRICDKFANPRYLMLLGFLLSIASVGFVGPFPFLPFEPTLPLVIIGLICLGFSMACILVPAFIDAIRSSVESGFSDGITTYGLVSGLWAASFSLGDFIGPSAAGFLDDRVGFRWGSLLLVFVHGTLFITMSIFVIRRRGRKRELYTNLTTLEPDFLQKEKEPLNIIASFPQEDYGSCSGISNGFTKHNGEV